jgi:2-oxoglutarate ferredoxin oxidoreductase subunit beta
MNAVTYTAKDYKSDLKPVWCPGCGDFSVLSSITKALADIGTPPHLCAVISGIGCSSRIPAYTNCYGFHSIHGRGLAVAAGVKLARPDLTVLAAGGDGDGFSIGGNHFIHACRRNVDMTYVVMNNRVYGMTKGQPSPTTEADWDASAMAPPGGTGVSPFHPLGVALSAGANFLARGFSGDPNGVAALIAQGIEHPGFSFIEVLSPCVTFREEQREWKNMVRAQSLEMSSDPAQAARNLMDDVGLNLGVLYKGTRPIYQPGHKTTGTVADLDKEFAL